MEVCKNPISVLISTVCPCDSSCLEASPLLSCSPTSRSAFPLLSWPSQCPRASLPRPHVRCRVPRALPRVYASHPAAPRLSFLTCSPAATLLSRGRSHWAWARSSHCPAGHQGPCGPSCLSDPPSGPLLWTVCDVCPLSCPCSPLVPPPHSARRAPETRVMSHPHFKPFLCSPLFTEHMLRITPNAPVVQPAQPPLALEPLFWSPSGKAPSMSALFHDASGCLPCSPAAASPSPPLPALSRTHYMCGLLPCTHLFLLIAHFVRASSLSHGLFPHEFPSFHLQRYLPLSCLLNEGANQEQDQLLNQWELGRERVEIAFLRKQEAESER